MSTAANTLMFPGGHGIISPFNSGRFTRRPKGEKTVYDPEQEALAAKTDEESLNNLIRQHKQWILRCASETAHRYITDSDDEWSAALLAFTEAVRDYEPEKGSFRGFAAVVIRRRLLDELRSQGRHSAEIVAMPGAFDGELSPEEASGVDLQIQTALARSAMERSADDSAQRAREEIGAMQELLQGYGFSFFDLADCSPKAEKTRKTCAQAVRALLADPALLEKTRRSHALPMKELAAASGTPRKILDRHRKYLIAAAEILSGDYPILAGYMDFIRKG